MTAVAGTKYNVGGVLLDRPFKIRRLGHFGFYLTHFAEAIHFYADLLGFRVSDIGPRGYHMRFTSDHHSFVLREKAAYPPQDLPSRPDNTIDQMSWQTQSLSEPVRAIDYFTERGVKLAQFGRDPAGSNWATYCYDPEGRRNELFYGMEQIGWNGHSKPAEYRRGRSGKIPLPAQSEFDDTQESLATTGVGLTAGHRHIEQMPAVYDVDGVLLPRPFKVVRHGPLYLFVDEMDEALDFYARTMGLTVTEQVVCQGETCYFLRCGTEHHSLGLAPKVLRGHMDVSAHTFCMAFGLQVANYRQLQDAVRFLRENGVRVETDAIPPELHPGIDYAAQAFDPDGHCVQLYCAMEQIGWHGRPRPRLERPPVDPNTWPEALESPADGPSGEPFFGPFG